MEANGEAKFVPCKVLPRRRNFSKVRTFGLRHYNFWVKMSSSQRPLRSLRFQRHCLDLKNIIGPPLQWYSKLLTWLTNSRSKTQGRAEQQYANKCAHGHHASAVSAGAAIRRSLACKTASINWSSVWSAGFTGAESAVSRRRENYILFMVYTVMHYLMLRLFMV